MKIQEAIESGYSFRRAGDKKWLRQEDMKGKILVMSFDDIVADDWEINKPKKRYWRWAYRKKSQEGHECWTITVGYYDDNMRDDRGDRGFSDEYAHEFCKLESDFIEV